MYKEENTASVPKTLYDRATKLHNKYPHAVKKVARKDGDWLYEMFSYVYADPKIFKEAGGKELRGITFALNSVGEVHIVARPFHKFFNIGEPEGLSLEELRATHNVRIADKIDGSLLQVAWFSRANKLFVASRNTLTPETSYVIQAFNKLPASLKAQIENLARKYPNHTHLFELVDPENVIVLHYDKLAVRYLVSREKYTGRYHVLTGEHVQFLQPVNWSNSITVEDVWQKRNQLKNVEGWVLAISSEYSEQPEFIELAKLKTRWYLDLHKLATVTTKSSKQIIDLFVDNTLDDAISQVCILEGKDGRRCRILTKVSEILYSFIDNVLGDKYIAAHINGTSITGANQESRKDVAIFLQNLKGTTEKEKAIANIRFTAIMSTYTTPVEERAEQIVEITRKQLKKYPQYVIDSVQTVLAGKENN